MIQDYLNFAFRSVKHRALRSWLTILGIVVGVATIMALIMISVGLQTAIEEQFEAFGPNRIIIAAKGFTGPGTQSEGISQKDVDVLDRMGDFSYVIPSVSASADVEYKDEEKFTLISGFPSEDFERAFDDVDIDVIDGRMYSKGEKFVAVIGFRAAKEMFEEEVQVKTKIKIKGTAFKVVGVFEEVGNSADDNAIMIPLEAARDIFNDPDRVDFVMAQAKPGTDIPFVQSKIERELERSRGNENFQVLTAAQILDQINQTLGIVQFVLIGIAGISLFVGGIGIMNSMYTSVLERTRDIGVMKSVGATKNDIMVMFLIESGLVGLIGGVIGVVLGTLMAMGVGYGASQAGFGLLKVTLNPWLILFGLAFAVGVGMLSGTLPAISASKLSPVDALRYE